MESIKWSIWVLKSKTPYFVAHPTNRKWLVTQVIHGIRGVNPLTTGVITNLLSGTSQVISGVLVTVCNHY